MFLRFWVYEGGENFFSLDNVEDKVMLFVLFVDDFLFEKYIKKYLGCFIVK